MPRPVARVEAQAQAARVAAALAEQALAEQAQAAQVAELHLAVPLRAEQRREGRPRGAPVVHREVKAAAHPEPHQVNLRRFRPLIITGRAAP